MKISVGNDHGGVYIAQELISFATENFSADVTYHGVHSDKNSVDYVDYARLVALDVASARSEFGILVCRSGVGMCIVANKMRGIRAVNCFSSDVAKLAREHNNANIICFGSNFISKNDAKNILKIFLTTEFAGGRHLIRLNKLSQLEG